MNDSDVKRARELNARGIRLGDAGLFNEAIADFKEAIAIGPDFLEAYNNLGKVYNAAGHFEACLDVCQKMLAQNPRLPMVLQNIAKTYGEMGKLSESLSFYYQALQICAESGSSSAYASALSDFFLTLNYTSASREAIFLEHCKFGRFDHPASQTRHPPSLKMAPVDGLLEKEGRPITLAYVSGDFREHPVAHLIVPILERHNRTKFKIILYSNVDHEDAITQKCKNLCDAWRAVRALSDAELAEKIRSDEVDILVDLSGHTGGNRIMVFAEKPAPIQVSWLGYMNTTGLKNMDYRITDSYLALPDAEKFYTEKLWRVPDSFTFHFLSPVLKIAPLPALKNGYVTFGSMNNFKKITDATLDLWAKILKAVPRSRLILSAKGDEQFHESILARFAGRGVSSECISIIGVKPLADFQKVFDEVDIALDTFPFSGCITVYHGLYAGVPSVVLEGPSEYERNGAAVMRKAGLADWIAHSQQEYFEIAVRQTSNINKLAELRPKIPLGFRKNEAEEVTRFAEAAFLGMVKEKYGLTH